MIRSEHMKSCLTAQIRFMLFQEPGSFKNFFTIGGNVDKLKGYRFIPLTSPLFFHFTLPLMLLSTCSAGSILCFKVKNYEYQAQKYEKINFIS
jgi:hypothetical protein